MSKAKPQAKKTQSDDAETKKQLAKVKKLITANNADSFALAVELVRTLELDNEATWLKLLSKSRVVQLVKLQDNRVTNLLLEIAGTGKAIKKTIWGNFQDAYSTSLDLDGLTSLSDAAAQALARLKGGLSLRGLKKLSDVAAQALAQHKGDCLTLDGLTSLSDAAAQALARHKGGLRLRGLKKLSAAAAQALAQHEGDIDFDRQGKAEKAVKQARKRLAAAKNRNKIMVASGCPEGTVYGLTSAFMAVKASEDAVHKALHSGKVDTGGADVDVLVQFDSGVWTLLAQCSDAPDAARDLSRILKTQAMHLIYGDTADTIEYHIYENGGLVEVFYAFPEEFLEFMDEGESGSVRNPWCKINSTHDGILVGVESRLSKWTKEALSQGADTFIDQRLKEFGIGVPEMWD